MLHHVCETVPMNLCTESDSFIIFKSWHGSLGNCVRETATKTGLRGSLACLFQVLLHRLLQKPCQTPNKKMASNLKRWRSHFAICTTEVKQKIVASRGFFPTCDIKNTEKPQPQPFCQTLYKMALASSKKSFYHSSYSHSCFSHSSAKEALKLVYLRC
jgi:hypothetical protein